MNRDTPEGHFGAMIERGVAEVLPGSYLRRLGVFDTTMVVIGGIIGAGIFLNPAIVAQRVHSAAFILTAWIVGGAVALVGALAFAELGARRPQAGGGYVYLTEAFGPLAAFLYGWTFLFIINSGGIAAVAVTFARYTVDLFGISTIYIKPLAAALLITLAGVNYFGIRSGSVTQNIFTVLKLVALAVLIFVGVFLARGGTQASAPSETIEGLSVVKGLGLALDRKSTRLNSSHMSTSYAVFCLKKKNTYELPRLDICVAGAANRARRPFRARLLPGVRRRARPLPRPFGVPLARSETAAAAILAT